MTRRGDGAAMAFGIALPPWPAYAGGNHIPVPRHRQGQSPRSDNRPQGICDLTRRAAPSISLCGAFEPCRNHFDARGQTFDTSRQHGFGRRRVVLRGRRTVAGTVALAAQVLGRLGQFVGDDEAGHQEQASVADLAPGLGELADLAIDILAELSDAVFLALVAGDLIAAPVDRQRNLRHYALRTALRRSIVASSLVATREVVCSSAEYSAFASASAATSRLLSAASPPAGPIACSRRVTASSNRLAACSSLLSVSPLFNTTP